MNHTMTHIRWKAMAKHCKPNVVLLPIRLTQDDTQQDKGGRRSLKPMYAELGNMRIQRRSELWTQICIGYVPTPNKNQRPANMPKEAWKRYKRQIFNDAMDLMLAPIRKYEKTGVKMVLPGRDGQLREVTVIPWMLMSSYDQPEVNAVLNKLDGYRNMDAPCSMCAAQCGGGVHGLACAHQRVSL